MDQWMQQTHRKGSYGWINSTHRGRHCKLVNKVECWWVGVHSNIDSYIDAEVRAVLGVSHVWPAWQDVASFS
jgi:hypothetical protein